jgi:hypothetical protein
MSMGRARKATVGNGARKWPTVRRPQDAEILGYSTDGV